MLRALRTTSTYFYRYKWHLLLGTLFVIASNYFAIIIPKSVRQAIDTVLFQLELYNLNKGSSEAILLRDHIAQTLLYFALIILVASLITGIFMYLMRQTIIVMSRLIEYDLRDDIFHHYLTLDQAYIQQKSTGDLMTRITEDVSKVRMFLGPGVLYTINTVSLFILVIITMFSVNPQLAWYTLAPLPVLSISIFYVSQLINKKSLVIQQQLAKLNSIAQEVYSGIRIVKAYVQEDALAKYYAAQSNEYKIKSMDLARVNALFFPLMILLIGISSVITVYVGGRLVIDGSVSPGNLAEFIIYINMLSWPVAAVGWIASIIQQAEASQSRINEIMHYQSPIDANIGSPKAIHGQIQLDKVTFTYPDSGIKALSDIDLLIKSKSSIAIVGRTAAGKTSLADVLFRMYDPQSGQVQFDGSPISQLQASDFRRQMAYVTQDTYLFSDTIANNLRIGKPDASDEELIEATKIADVFHDIMEFPDQFQTRIGERGVALSGGQKQRISLARALITDPKVLLLDDCLSAVDVNTEERIIKTLLDVLRARTTVFITHRLAILPHFNHIIIMDEGQIITQGNHTQLLESDTWYYELFTKQMQKIH